MTIDAASPLSPPAPRLSQTGPRPPVWCWPGALVLYVALIFVNYLLAVAAGSPAQNCLAMDGIGALAALALFPRHHLSSEVPAGPASAVARH